LLSIFFRAPRIAEGAGCRGLEAGGDRLLLGAAGAAVLNLIEKQILPKDILTKKAFENAIAVSPLNRSESGA